MGNFTDKHFIACQSCNDRLRLRLNLPVTCFPDLGHVDYESAYILVSSAENFATTSGGRVFGIMAIFLCYSLSVCQKKLAGLEFLLFVGGRGCMYAFLLTVERHNNTSASVSLQMPILVGPAYRKRAVHVPRTATTGK